MPCSCRVKDLQRRFVRGRLLRYVLGRMDRVLCDVRRRYAEQVSQRVNTTSPRWPGVPSTKHHSILQHPHLPNGIPHTSTLAVTSPVDASF